jgi:endonuclease/exonuclease/phosphatase family metal-dependent hydrolase
VATKENKYKLSFIGKLFFLLNLIVVGLLFLSYTAVYFNPISFSLPAFAGLSYPIILAVNLLFIIIWFFIRPRYILFSLISVLVGWNHLAQLLPINSTKEIPKETTAIKILSFNVQNFLKVNITNTKYISDFENQNEILGYIQNKDADIVFLQEFLYDRKEIKNFTEWFGKQINCPYSHTRNYFEQKDKKLDAIAIFSRFPIINRGHVEFDRKSIAIFADIILDNDTIRIYNLHLASIHLKKEDYDFISEMDIQQDKDEMRIASRAVASKVKAAFIKRGEQVGIVKGYLRNSPYPIILAGDFNDTPVSFTYHQLTKDLKDAFVESGSGFGNTYAGDNFPALRIDYILHDESFTSINFTRDKIHLSDHYPINCILYKD